MDTLVSAALEAIETQLIQMQRLTREIIHLSGEGGLDESNRQHSQAYLLQAKLDLLNQSKLTVSNLAVSGAISWREAVFIAKLFHQADRQAFWKSNATLWADDHPLVQALRGRFQWIRFKSALKNATRFPALSSSLKVGNRDQDHGF